MLVGDFKMNYLEIIKLIAETITAISAAIVVLIHLFKNNSIIYQRSY